MVKDAHAQTLASAGRTGTAIKVETWWWHQVQGAQGILDTNGLFLFFLQCLCSNPSILWKLLNCFKEKSWGRGRWGEREREKKKKKQTPFHVLFFPASKISDRKNYLYVKTKSHSWSLEFWWFCLIVLQVYHAPWRPQRNISDALLGRGTCQIWTYCRSSLYNEIPHRRMLSGRKLALGEVKTHTQTHTHRNIHTHTLEPNKVSLLPIRILLKFPSSTSCLFIFNMKFRRKQS